MRRAFVLAIPFAFLAAACTYDNGDAQHIISDNNVCGGSSEWGIDTDRQIDVNAGVGAGLYIEYASGGHYHVSASCDTTTSGTSCQWDVIVTPQAGSTLSNVQGENLDAHDSLEPYADGSYDLLTSTTTEIDGFTFDIQPGSAVSVDARLDGDCANSYYFWVGSGALHQGAPTDPVTLLPSAP